MLLAEPNDPQAPVLPQVTVQLTPALLESLETMAVSVAVALVCKDVGGELNVTEIIGGGGVLLEPPPQATQTAAEQSAINSAHD